MTVRVRIAPSPTGDPHVGTAYIALFNTAFARQRGGQFVLRIEDTDRERSTRESEVAILDSLRWLGLSWDEGPDVGGPHAPYRQSERLPIYKEHVDKLLASGKAYWCDCTKERLDAVRKERAARKDGTQGYDGHCRERGLSTGSVVRLKVPREPGRAFSWTDPLRPDQKPIAASEVDDQVLLKSDGFPTYHLANVVDDHLMEITHVLRGEEWISSAPKHVILYESFGWQCPEFIHLPLLRNADKSKVSKRKNPVSLSWFREAGYLPEAMVNFLGTMAHTFEDQREVFSLAELIEGFRLERVVLGGPVFDLKKLLDLNGRYLREKMSDADIVRYLKERLFDDATLERIVAASKTRWEKSEDFVDYASYFFAGSVSFDLQNAVIRGKTVQKTPAESAALFAELVERVDAQFGWTQETVKSLVEGFCADKELGKDLLGPLRWVVTGKKATPGLWDVLAILGRERVRTRIRAVLDPLKKLT